MTSWKGWNCSRMHQDWGSSHLGLFLAAAILAVAILTFAFASKCMRHSNTSFLILIPLSCNMALGFAAGTGSSSLSSDLKLANEIHNQTFLQVNTLPAKFIFNRFQSVSLFFLFFCL